MEKVVSIVMPTYNCADYIADSIRSVQEQTYPHWELWIIDDISTDNTEKCKITTYQEVALKTISVIIDRF
jgi:glycosyltransferase involved in cell wall biosynthesis